MALSINKRVWVLVERLYIHISDSSKFIQLLKESDIHYSNELYNDLNIDNTKTYYTFMSEENFTFADAMELTPSYKYLPLLEKIIVDSQIQKTKDDGWNYYGEPISKWYPDLIELISLAGIKVTSDKLCLAQEEAESISASDDFLKQECGDVFLDYIQKEINELFISEHYLSVMFLSRKLLESFIIRILEIVFPKIVNKEYNDSNHNIWYNKQHGRYHSFDILLDNIKSNSFQFHEDADLILELVSLIKPFKNETNKCIHNDYKIPDETYVKQWRIPYIIGMGRKIFRKYCNP